jgi:hypothetical protein
VLEEMVMVDREVGAGLAGVALGVQIEVEWLACQARFALMQVFVEVADGKGIDLVLTLKLDKELFGALCS